MKKTVLMLAAVMFLVFTSACSVKDAQAPTNSISLYNKGVELTAQVDLLAENTDYVKLCTSNESLNKIVADIGGQDYEKPKAVYEIVGLGDAALAALLEQADIKLDAGIKDITQKRFGASLASQINARSGTEFLAATAILSVEDYFLYSGLEQQKVYLLLYGGEYSSMVAFMPYKDNIVGAAANIVKDKAFAEVEAAEDVIAYFAEAMEMKGLTVSLVEE